MEAPLRLSVPFLRRLTLSQEEFAFPDATAQDFNQGHLQAEEVLRVRVVSNGPWTLTVKAEDEVLGLMGGQEKPIADLLWKRSNLNIFTPLGIQEELVAQSLYHGGSSGLDLDFRLLLDWVEDGPGDYSTILTFTLGAPL